MTETLFPVFLDGKLATVAALSRLWDVREVTHSPGPLLDIEAEPVELTFRQRQEAFKAIQRMSDVTQKTKRHRRA